jgi:hypothetical protein
MAEFNIRGDNVDVDQIMRQIRARIREKRGVDYTEQEIQEMANVKLEKFLDPQGVRSDLVAQFRQARHETEPLNFAFEDTTLFDSHRAILRWMRKLLRPILKLFFNPAPIAHALNVQSRLNTARHELDPLYYEVIHNLVLEMTRLSIETKNLKMRLESVSSRLEFNERRARALEGVVQYRATTGSSEPIAQPSSRSVQESAAPAAGGGGQAPGLPAEGPGQRSRRRRRRRGRRGGTGQPEHGGEPGGAPFAASDEGDAGPDDRHEAGEGPQESAAPDRAEGGSHRSDAEAGDFES